MISAVELTVLGSGSPIPDADRAGPSGLIEGGGARILIDCGRGVLMRLAATGLMVAQLDAVVLTHLHSDHTTDFNDVLTTWWVLPMTGGRALQVVGPPGTARFVDATIAALAADIGYRIEHHDDITEPPRCEVTELLDGEITIGGLRVVTAVVDHGVVRPAIGYRFEDAADGGGAVVWAGDTLPAPGLDRLCAGAAVYVQTVVRRSMVEAVPVQRFRDILDYHSDLPAAGRTAATGGVRTLVLNHPVPAPPPGTEAEWVAEAAEHFDGEIVLANDLSRFTA
jgi:ribonuclease Z